MFEEPVLGRFGLFHPAMTVGKFILAVSDQFKLHFISKLFSLRLLRAVAIRTHEV